MRYIYIHIYIHDIFPRNAEQLFRKKKRNNTFALVIVVSLEVWSSLLAEDYWLRFMHFYFLSLQRIKILSQSKRQKNHKPNNIKKITTIIINKSNLLGSVCYLQHRQRQHRLEGHADPFCAKAARRRGGARISAEKVVIII